MFLYVQVEIRCNWNLILWILWCPDVEFTVTNSNSLVNKSITSR